MAGHTRSNDVVCASDDLPHARASSTKDCPDGIGKRSDPGAQAVLLRQRLFRRLDEMKAGGVMLIHGPPGSGKTTLAASYVASRNVLCLRYQVTAADQHVGYFFQHFGVLAAKVRGGQVDLPPSPSALDHIGDIGGFSRAYFRRLYTRLAHPFLVVVDDYQEVSATAFLHQALYEACLALPALGRILVLSRMGSPPGLSRIDGTGRLTRLAWDDLQLTLDETLGVLQARSDVPLPDDIVDSLHRRCGGWVAGLIQHIESTREALDSPRDGDAAQLSPAHAGFSSEKTPATGRCWPIKVYTLGRFAVLKDGAKLTWPGKAQHKPIELLKALIALGGREVAAGCLAEILWPDAEGDAAHRAFDTTLHRLRKLLGHPEALGLHDGKLTLDASHVWVDVWLLQRHLSRLEDALKNVARDKEILIPLKNRLLSLYQRPFLDDDQDQSWVMPLRDRLHQRLQQVLGSLGCYLESMGAWEKACECYQEGIRLEPRAEMFYRHLMALHMRHGQRGEAAVVYGRCWALLTRGLGLAPSPEMQRLYQSLLA